MSIKKITITFNREARHRKSILEVVMSGIEKIVKAFIRLCEVTLTSNLRPRDKAESFRQLILAFALLFQAAILVAIFAWMFVQK